MKTITALLFIVSLAVTQHLSAAEEVDTSPAPVKIVKVFPYLKIDRPIVITHAGDNSDRLFIASQKGKIFIVPNTPEDEDVEEGKLFLDISDRVVYNDKQNEEGLLGFAFHPNYEQNGEFFVYYSTADKPQNTSVISRFRVSKDSPDKSLADSEEVMMRVKQPAWNHNGGTLAFGKDGKLYIAFGDGGGGNDVFKNGQNLTTVLGSICRIDVDHKDPGLNYAIPKDNPFVEGKSAEIKTARKEIWAFGFRNPWRIAFDSKTGVLWAGDVGQGIWEEIDIVIKGGNYGWSVREGKHPFGPNGVEAREHLIEPIWEYDHKVGKSITGGSVYRGKAIPAIVGSYIYGDYVSGKFWALKYDAENKKVTANHVIQSPSIPVMTFGEGPNGEMFLSSSFSEIFMLKAK
ncbi:PQQ-dependent sugar dehydrogenase [Gimesia fumaroli]|uniref:Quinoprotein glucose dehydrogenase B n=1 Tax=Gimesia fumaroli TaxID=2527976 RepID=A0A518IF08_9PLAN|nr:PQQ-dependent sugar dehydrogenase [Gimesia fumaroli]QDV51679.1 Quinoprotein glucose dehydrogenase B precursor [Gimesia fumaroli]